MLFPIFRSFASKSLKLAPPLILPPLETSLKCSFNAIRAVYMLKGIGNDIIEISRIERAIQRHGDRFLNKIFTPKERAYCAGYAEAKRHYAGRFAAKEAVVKALGTGFRLGISWIDIEILNDALGKPVVYFSKHVQALLGDVQCLISISHCREFASAVAVIV